MADSSNPSRGLTRATITPMSPEPVLLRPSPVLSPFVAYFFVLEAPAPAPSEPPTSARVLPLPHAQLVFGYGDPSTERFLGSPAAPSPDYAITGFLSQIVEYACPGRLGVMMAGLHPWGLRPFLRGEIPDLLDRNVPLGEVCRGVPELERGLRAAGTTEERQGLVEAFLMRNLRQPALDQPIVEAVEQLVESVGRADLGELARGIGLSERQFRRRFQAAIGLPPRRFAQILRFQKAIEALDQAAPPSMAALARDAGYYDQSHFINDFRAFTGLSPRAYQERMQRTEVGRAFDAGHRPEDPAAKTYV